MPSFDAVSELDMQEVDNAVNQVVKEIANRFDFRGTNSELELDKVTRKITMRSDSEDKLEALTDILRGKLIKRGVDIRTLDIGKREAATGRTLRCEVQLKNGIDKEAAKKVTTFIRDSKIKVTAQIQDEKVRITGKKRDDLQDIMAKLKAEDFGLPLQFENFRD
jgi:uncharacterized protein YajQ (UPF0234 family)